MYPLSSPRAAYRTRHLVIVTAMAVVGMLSTSALYAQRATPKSGGSAVRAVFEPVNYTEDIELTGVFFVTPDIGWVSGRNGTLLRTTDGGEHWEAQMGGDPASTDKAIWAPRFIDETHGWAVQSTGTAAKLLRTTNGDRWTQIGTIPENYTDYAFTSETNGVYAAKNQISHTSDGGRSWKLAGVCHAKAEIKGLTREIDCHPTSIHFPSPNVGYAVGYVPQVNELFSVMKTTDGGETWSVSIVPNAALATSVFFIDEQNGYIRTAGSRIFATTDGGESWEGLTGSAAELRFADREVGWSFVDRGFSYTVDGGNHWVKRPLALPARVAAFSLPRRDRGYAVGDHGMIYRYRIVPASYANAKAIDAPVMPAFNTALDKDIQQITEQVSALEQNLADGSTAAAAATGSAAAPADATDFMKKCCGKRLSNLQFAFEAATGLLPDFLHRFRSLNLLVQGLRTAHELPVTADSLKAALKQFRGASDRATARDALARVSAQLASFKQVADSVMLKQGASSGTN